MQILITALQLAAIMAAMLVMGYAAVKLLLPEDIERESGILVMPTTGFLLVCLVAYTLSASLGMSAGKATLAAMVLLAIAAVAVASRPRWRPRFGGIGAHAARGIL